MPPRLTGRWWRSWTWCGRPASPKSPWEWKNLETAGFDDGRVGGLVLLPGPPPFAGGRLDPAGQAQASRPHRYGQPGPGVAERPAASPRGGRRMAETDAEEDSQDRPGCQATGPAPVKPGS